MTAQKYRQLKVDLPRQTIVDPRPWFIAGITFAAIILLMFAYAYFDQMAREGSTAKQKQGIVESDK